MAAPTVSAGPNGLVITATYPRAMVEVDLTTANQVRRVQLPPWARVAFVSFWDKSTTPPTAIDGAVYQEGSDPTPSVADNDAIPTHAEPVPAGVATDFDVAASQYDTASRSRVGSEIFVGAYTTVPSVARIELRAARPT